MGYHKPRTVKEACSLLASAGTTPIAGGTDVLIKMRRGALRNTTLVSLDDIDGLSGIRETGDGIEIGSGTKLSTVASDERLATFFPAIGQGALNVGTPQIRNLGTIGGNICNASPCADTAPGLLVSSALVVASNGDRERTIPIGEFWSGPGRNNLEKGEMVTAFLLPKPDRERRQGFMKLGPRRAADIAIVNMAMSLFVRDGVCTDVRIALGSVAPTPIRASSAEKMMESVAVDKLDFAAIAEATADDARPISDVRGTAWYRREALCALSTGLLETLLGGEGRVICHG